MHNSTGNFVVHYTKPWAAKYLGLVLEYMVNRFKDVNKVTLLKL